MHKKSPQNSGISLIIALGTSLFILAVILSVSLIIRKSLEKTSHMERSTQLFYAAESGMEAALYHHNARNERVHFSQEGLPEQTINLDQLGAVSYWKILGRTTPGDPYYGVFQPGRKIEFPFFMETSIHPGEMQTSSASDMDFELEIYESIADFPNTTAGNAARDQIRRQFGNIDLAGLGELGDSTRSDILIGWQLIRNNNGVVKNWTPKSQNVDITDCGSESAAFICEEDLSIGWSIDSGSLVDGRALPGLTTQSLQSFVATPGRHTISLQPLLKFEDDNGKKFPGIPFRIQNNGSLGYIAKPFFTIESEVTMGNFTHKILVDVPEKTSIGAFDYVIFD